MRTRAHNLTAGVRDEQGPLTSPAPAASITRCTFDLCNCRSSRVRHSDCVKPGRLGVPRLGNLSMPLATKVKPLLACLECSPSGRGLQRRTPCGSIIFTETVYCPALTVESPVILEKTGRNNRSTALAAVAAGQPSSATPSPHGAAALRATYLHVKHLCPASTTSELYGKACGQQELLAIALPN